MKFHIPIESINEKILQAIVNSNDQNVKIIKNSFPPVDEGLSEAFFDDPKNFSNPDMVEKLKAMLSSMKDGSQAIVFIDDVRYHFNKRPMGTDISLSRYKKPDFTGLNEKYYQKITDYKTFVKYFEEVASQIEQKHFLKFKEDDYDEFWKFSIASVSVMYGIYYYISNDYINLCEKYSYALNESDLELIERLKKNQFVETEGEEISELDVMFKAWFKFLSKKKANKEFVFNDHDNYAFVTSNEKYELMTQRSQNTYYVYVREKETNRYKIWNAALIDNEPYFEKDNTYFDSITDTLNPYGYAVYPCNLDHIFGYTKSPLYYLDNFDSEENIIFDTAKGYNSRSKHPANLMSDFSLLHSVLNQL